MSITVEYHGGKWMVRGVWNSTQKRQLMDRMKAIQPAKNKQASNHRGDQASLREIQQLRQQLRDALQVNEETSQRLQQMEGVNRRLTTTVNQLQTQLEGKEVELQQKDEALQQKDEHLHAILQRNNAVLQQKDESLQQKDEALQQSTLQIRDLENTVATKNDIIQQNNTTILEQQQEIVRYRNNPHWSIQGEEVEITGPVLGRGGWGEVKVGIFRKKKVAIKCLYEAILSPHYLDLFSREMEFASRIRHPNLLQFIGATRVGNLMIVTELMETSLRSELEKSPRMSKIQVISIAADVACGLNYLHSWRPQPILHRDVSSANVLMDSSSNGRWRAKVSDYGSVNLVENIQTANPGNPVYSAPESSDPARHSPAMDVYSFGVLLMETVTRQFPSSVMHEREAQVRAVKWGAVRDLIVHCTIRRVESRPNTSTVLDRLREMELEEYT